MKVILEIYPHYIVRPLEVGNVEVLFIGNKQDNVRINFPLYDSYAHFAGTAKTKQDLKDVLLFVYADMLKMVEDSSFVSDDSKSSWIDVRDRVRTRLSNRNEFRNPDNYVGFPFGEEVMTTFVIEVEGESLVNFVTKKMLANWDISEQQLLETAMNNLMERADNLQLAGTAPPRGYLWTDSKEEFAATTILIGGVRETVAQNIGVPFRFGIPSRYIFYAWAELEDEEFQIQMKAMMEREFERLPSKLTTKIYEVNEQGQIKQLKDQPETKTPPHISNN